jgi:hypothetical protein
VGFIGDVIDPCPLGLPYYDSDGQVAVYTTNRAGGLTARPREFVLPRPVSSIASLTHAYLANHVAILLMGLQGGSQPRSLPALNGVTGVVDVSFGI